MMDFEEFKSTVAENIKDYLPMDYADAEVTLQNVTKNNDLQLTGILIMNEESNIAPTIYLDGYYERYADGEDMSDILFDIADTRLQHEMPDKFDVSKITDFDQVKDRIICKLVNAEMNTDYLSNRPYTQMEDLAVIYAIDLGTGQGGSMSVPITDNLMQRYGLSTEELHEIALANLSEKEASFKSMREMFADMIFPDGIPEGESIDNILPTEEGCPTMYVLTNKEKINGAAAILDSKTMESISEKLGGDFIVLPSSIHEVIILPVTEDSDRQTLENMVQEVNAGQVEPEERLSDHVYQYDSKEHELVRMDKLEERNQQRQASLEGAKLDEKAEKKPDRERVSMKEKIPEKKAEAARNETMRDKAVPNKVRSEAALA